MTILSDFSIVYVCLCYIYILLELNHPCGTSREMTYKVGAAAVRMIPHCIYPLACLLRWGRTHRVQLCFYAHGLHRQLTETLINIYVHLCPVPIHFALLIFVHAGHQTAVACFTVSIWQLLILFSADIRCIYCSVIIIDGILINCLLLCITGNSHTSVDKCILILF